MYKYILEGAGDISLLALIPLTLFVIVFLVALVRTMIRNNNYIDRMANLPLDDSNIEID